MSSPPRPRLADGTRIEWDEVRSEHLLLFPEGLLRLNESAAEVLRLCDGERTIADIISVLEERYPGHDLAADVEELVRSIAEKGFVIGVR